MAPWTMVAWGVAAALSVPEGRPTETEVTVEPRTHFGFGASYGAPLGPAALVEVLHGLGGDVREDSTRVNGLVGLLVQVHAGRDGGKLSLGAGTRARVHEDGFQGRFTAALKASLVRTWSRDEGRRRSTYLGPELEVSAWHVGLSIGVLARLHGPGGLPLRFTWSLGLRL